jgi:hypothetical protein
MILRESWNSCNLLGLFFARLSKHCNLHGMRGACIMSGNAFVHTVSESSALLRAPDTHTHYKHLSGVLRVIRSTQYEKSRVLMRSHRVRK